MAAGRKQSPSLSPGPGKEGICFLMQCNATSLPRQTSSQPEPQVTDLTQLQVATRRQRAATWQEQAQEPKPKGGRRDAGGERRGSYPRTSTAATTNNHPRSPSPGPG